jgi:hypothetical protein
MPDRPSWLLRLPGVLHQLRESDKRYMTTAQLAVVLKVSQRQAQKIFRPLFEETIGHTYVLDRCAVLRFLENYSGAADYEDRRRRRLARLVETMKQQALVQPRVLVDAPPSIVRTELEDLAGVRLAPGQIIIEGFRSETEALEKLLALAMAIGNDQEGFARRISNHEG